jgi:hypothetical protein
VCCVAVDERIGMGEISSPLFRGSPNGPERQTAQWRGQSTTRTTCLETHMHHQVVIDIDTRNIVYT